MEKEYTEINLSEKQVESLKQLLEKKEKTTSLFDKITAFLTLKNSGKLVSTITLTVVMIVVLKFLDKHQYSIEAMQMVLPFLTQIAMLVFGIIGGVKGAKGIIDKVKNN